jgi:exonuclease III
MFTVCAGDWNLTYSTEGVGNNIDIFNMIAPPSLVRSALLASICEDLQLTDPFRLLHYRTRDYTYVPRGDKKNRSRLDFFLVSDNLLAICNRCTIYISPSLDTSLFDHKSIKLEFNILKKIINISLIPINHRRFESVVATSVVET